MVIITTHDFVVVSSVGISRIVCTLFFHNIPWKQGDTLLGYFSAFAHFMTDSIFFILSIISRSTAFWLELFSPCFVTGDEKITHLLQTLTCRPNLYDFHYTRIQVVKLLYEPRQAKMCLRTCAKCIIFKFITRMRRVSTGHLLSIHTFCSIQWF